MSSDTTALHIGVSSWIIQDGNYGDFTVDRHEAFALEYWSRDGLRTAPDGPLTAQHLGGARYQVRARVIFLCEDACVIDTGAFVAYGDGAPTDARAGASIAGELYLGIDPFTYTEQLCAIPGMPPLAYRWRVRAIQLETTPWVERRQDNGALIRERADGAASFTTVSTTNAWHDDGGNAHYVMTCTREGGPHARG